MNHRFLFHDPRDNLGVAIADIRAGERVVGVCLKDNSSIDVEAINDIPLGHKISLQGIPKGTKAIKYGVAIGVAAQPIAPGEHVHIHNLRSARW